jgi:hypothetical protein
VEGSEDDREKVSKCKCITGKERSTTMQLKVCTHLKDFRELNISTTMLRDGHLRKDEDTFQKTGGNT